MVKTMVTTCNVILEFLFEIELILTTFHWIPLTCITSRTHASLSSVQVECLIPVFNFDTRAEKWRNETTIRFFVRIFHSSDDTCLPGESSKTTVPSDLRPKNRLP